MISQVGKSMMKMERWTLAHSEALEMERGILSSPQKFQMSCEIQWKPDSRNSFKLPGGVESNPSIRLKSFRKTQFIKKI
jgi:hypothetical protein